MTSTEVATTEQTRPVKAEESMSNYLFKMAKLMAHTEVVPKNLRGRPDAIFAVLHAGDSLGLDPTTSLQSFISIDGKLAMSAELMRSLILSRGHKIDFEEMSGTQCVLYGRRKDDGGTARITWTIEDAQRAKLVKAGGAWEKYPRALLLARATTELARTLFPDVINGISYSPEELQSVGGSPEFEPVETEGIEFVTDKITFEIEDIAIDDEPIAETPVQDIDETPVEPVVETPVEAEKPEPKITQAQMKKAFAIANKLSPELKEKSEEGRKLLFGDKSRRDYTKTEANQWVEYLLSLEEEAQNG